MKRTAVRKSLRDLRERAILLVGFAGLLFVPAVYVTTGFPSAAELPFSVPIAALGTVVLAIALWVFLRSHAELGRNWSISLEMRSNHRLVQTGVYRFVRHPMYSSFFLLGLAQFLLLPNWVGGGAGTCRGGNPVRLPYRTRRDDDAGELWRRVPQLHADTKRLVPWII